MTTKKRSILVCGVILVAFLSCVIGAVTTTVSNFVDQTSVSQKDKVIEVESSSCKKAKSNEVIYKQILDVDAQAFMIASDIIGNYNYYMYNPYEMQKKNDELNVLVNKKKALLNQLQ